jgi:hypothetical protein
MFFTGCVEVGTILDQDIDDVRATVSSRGLQCTPMSFIGCVEVCTFLAQDTDDFRATVSSRGC